MPEPMLPEWCTDSLVTQSYIAQLNDGGSHWAGYEQATTEVCAQATAHYLESIEAATVTTQGLDMATAAGWSAFARQIVTGFSDAHKELIISNAPYRTKVAAAMDAYYRHTNFRSPTKVYGSRKLKRQINYGQELMANAVHEGLQTAMATFEVVPRVVSQDLAHLSIAEQAEVAISLLPAANNISFALARHSKNGDHQFLKAVATPTSLMGRLKHEINYDQLHFMPSAFRLQTVAGKLGTLTIASNVDAHCPKDLQTYFDGCPALKHRSIARLLTMIRRIIQDEHCYERALQAPAYD